MKQLKHQEVTIPMAVTHAESTWLSSLHANFSISDLKLETIEKFFPDWIIKIRKVYIPLSGLFAFFLGSFFSIQVKADETEVVHYYNGSDLKLNQYNDPQCPVSIGNISGFIKGSPEPFGDGFFIIRLKDRSSSQWAVGGEKLISGFQTLHINSSGEVAHAFITAVSQSFTDNSIFASRSYKISIDFSNSFPFQEDGTREKVEMFIFKNNNSIDYACEYSSNNNGAWSNGGSSLVSTGSSYNIQTHILTMPVVSIDGAKYEVNLDFDGDKKFTLIDSKPSTQPSDQPVAFNSATGRVTIPYIEVIELGKAYFASLTLVAIEPVITLELTSLEEMSVLSPR